MALAKDEQGRVGRLFSGHEPDGRPDTAGRHAHVFLAADNETGDHGAITRLVVAAPWAADRGARPQRDERRLFDTVARRLAELRAGRLGLFRNLAATPVAEGDPLIGPAKMWIGTTPYVATRNLGKRDDAEYLVRADAAVECVRRGFPLPVGIDVLDARARPSGARPTAMLKLRFAVAVRGPLLLGRDSHAGGGLFHAEPAKAGR